MSITTTTIAVGRWENRANLEYIPCNNMLKNGKSYDARGVSICSFRERAAERRPYKIEELDGVTYVMYDDDANRDVPIFKMVQEG